ncbi:MAG TPA: TRAP transporter large permease [Bacteroidota bacterium]|nr:TRAP transporter large permease [Bacteroidota bacterium]
MNYWLVVFLLVLIALFGAPLFTVFGAFVLFAFSAIQTDTSVIIISLYQIAEISMLVAIPLFVFGGYLLAESKAPQRMVALAQALFGWMPGGLAIVTLVTCAIFTSFTGASGVTIIALGGILYPILLAEKYPEKFSMGLVTASGSVGLLFPPSLPVILYGIVTQVSINQLYLAGVIPGILFILVLSFYSVKIGISEKVPRIRFSWKNVAKAAREAAWEIPLPFIVVGGIYGGYFTATEAAAVTAFYAFVVEVFVYRDLHLFKDVPRVIKQSMLLVGATMAILGIAFALTNYFIDQQVPQRLLEMIQSTITSQTKFLLVLNGFLLVVGMTMEMFPAILVVVPLILPIAREFRVNELHLGIIFLTNMEVAYLTPPFGLNLFLSSLRFRRPVFNIARSVLIFILLEFIALFLITYIPELSLWLVNLKAAQ